MNSIWKKSAALLLAFAVTLSALVFSANLTVHAAEKKTGIGLAEFGLQAYRDNWQYNYGSYGEVGPDGLNRSDCSGLIYAYLCWQDGGVVHDWSMPRTVTAQAERSIASGPISTLPRTHGLLLTIEDYNHVGIYLGNDKSVDNSDYGTNMVLRTVSKYSSWIQWHKLDCVEYPTNGWYTFDGTPFYYQNGEYVINTSLNIDGTTYSFDSSGTPSPTPVGYTEGGGDSDSPDNVSEAGKATTAVNLRKGPSTSYNVITTVGTGTSLTVTNMDNPSWYKVKLANGTVGYMASEYISLNGDSSSGGGSAVDIKGKTTADVNFRSSPSTSSDNVIKVIGEGTALTIIEKTNSSWYKVKLSDGSTGYIFAGYLEETAETPATPAPPPAEDIAAYTTADVNLRSGPGTSNSVIKVVGSKTVVTIIDKSSAGWYKVKLSDGTEGYMSADYVTEGTMNETPSTPAVSIPAKTTAVVNLRTGAGTNHSVIKVVGDGITITITDKSNAGWYKVKLADGTEGYMSADYIRETGSDGGNTEPPVATGSAKTTADVNVRTGPGMGYGVIRVIGSGTSVTVTDNTNSAWYKVTLSDGTEGYISAQYISAGGGSSGSPASTMTTTADLNLRNGASLSAQVLTVVGEGTRVTVLDTSDSSWYKVKLASGTEGYMSTDFLR